ncbi:MAG: hypothetical protein ABIT96_09915 [Ferruginibacter sp.]
MKNCLVLIFLWSCGAAGCYSPRYVYSTPAQNVPVLAKKGDAEIAAYYSTNLASRSDDASKNLSVKNNGYDIHAAYAYSRHGALQFSFAGRSETNDGNYLSRRDSVTIKYRRFMMEAGIGYYQPLHDQQHFNFQFFAGMGTGHYRINEKRPNTSMSGETNFYHVKALKVYLQPALLVNPYKTFNSGFSSRFSIVKLYDDKSDYFPQDLDNYKLDSLTRFPVIFWEPAFINSLGFKNIPALRLEFQAVFTFLLSRNFVDARPFNFSAGIYLDPHVLFKPPLKSK